MRSVYLSVIITTLRLRLHPLHSFGIENSSVLGFSASTEYISQHKIKFHITTIYPYMESASACCALGVIITLVLVKACNYIKYLFYMLPDCLHRS